MHPSWQSLYQQLSLHRTSLVVGALLFIALILLLIWITRNRYLYEKREHLATRAEQRFLKLLHRIVSDDYCIHCQVSLAAMLNPLSLRSARMIWAKRMDYVITDKNSRILCIIELDDASHARKDRRKRDKFVNKILKNKHILVRFTSEQSRNAAFVKKTIDNALKNINAQ